MRMTSKGQVTIPKNVRDSAGIKPGADLSVVYDQGVIKVLRQKRSTVAADEQARATWLNRVRGVSTSDISTEEILAMTRDPDHGNSSR
jgi:antitoxin PrlF